CARDLHSAWSWRDGFDLW
nr:immunoglobulin heavy chain junction region [Macaca mulatta]MOX00957.1 immunoglobulin heavy chain junction region [Macaca mulatta]MOX03567.1 immunoglobulin heavy chain junction region [Macaca mulatta]